MHRILALLLVSFGMLNAPPPCRAAASKPNIVFILVDDLGWKDGRCFGSEFYRTPSLDRLASQSVRFTSAYAACAVCSPTRAAIMTGKAPARLHLTDWIAGEGTPKEGRFRVPDWQQSLPRVEVTLPEALRELGYATASVGKWHLGHTNSSPRDHGFDLNVAGGPIGHPASYFWPYGKPDASHRVPGLADRGGSEGEYLTDRLTDEALSFLERNHRRPFFLYLAHYAVHSPLMGKPSLVDEYRDTQGADGQSNVVYAAMVQSVDDSVGRILAKLDELGIAERTMIVYTSDNGGAVHFGTPTATSNTPLRMGKGYPYEGGLRVPLLIKVPGLTRGGSVCNTPVISQDFFPTLLELAGASRRSRSTGIDGASLVPLLKGGGKSARRSLFWHYPHYWNGTKVSPYSVVRDGDWKLIRFYETDKEELYNLRVDPGETSEESANQPATRADLSAKLDGWLKRVDAQMPQPK